MLAGFSMPIPVGGRGIKAPYETTHLRVPVPLKEQFEVVINDYKEKVTQDNNLLTSYQISGNNSVLMSLEDAKKRAKYWIKRKQKKESMFAAFLSEIYQTEVTADELMR